jgi:hypothetical protein
MLMMRWRIEAILYIFRIKRNAQNNSRKLLHVDINYSDVDDNDNDNDDFDADGKARN